MSVPDGHAIGSVSLAEASGFQPAPPDEIADVSSWVGVTRRVDPVTGMESSVVELAARWRYDTGETTRVRIMNTLQNAVSWERATLSGVAPNPLGDLWNTKHDKASH